MNSTTPTYTNKLVSGAELFRVHSYPPWEDYLTATWSGYIWNRSETNEVWTFALNFGGYAKVWIDKGATVLLQIDDNQGMCVSNKIVTPGAHLIVIKANPRSYRIGGSLPGSSVKHYKLDGSGNLTAGLRWANDMGFAIDRLGRGTVNAANFEFVQNNPAGLLGSTEGGDGFLFTQDTREPSDFDADELLAMTARGQQVFSNFVAHAGTTVDLGEGNMFPFVLDTFEGVTTVTNGGFRIKDAWRLRPELVGTLMVYGKLKFDADVALEWADLSLLPRSGEYVIARATEGIEGMPAWTPARESLSRWHLEKAQDGDGNDILRFRWQAGSIVSFR